MTLSPDLAKRLPHLLMGGGAGAVLTIVLVLVQKEPGAVVNMFRAWGPASLVGIVAVVLASRAFDQVIDVGRQIVSASAQTARSQQQLADAVNLIAKKDDERAREDQLVLDYLSRNSQALLSEIQASRRDMAAQAAQLAAIEQRYAQAEMEKAGGEKSHAHTAGR